MAFVLVLVFSLDRILKIIAFSYPEISFALGNNFFHFSLSLNNGFCFLSLFSYRSLLIFYLLGFCVLGYYLWRERKLGREKAVWALILALVGALSNFIDRVTIGYVVDYLSLLDLTFFNLADLAVWGGVGILIVSTIKEKSL